MNNIQKSIVAAIWVMVIMAIVLVCLSMIHTNGVNRGKYEIMERLGIDHRMYTEWRSQSNSSSPWFFSHQWSNLDGYELISDPVVYEDARMAGRKVLLHNPSD